MNRARTYRLAMGLLIGSLAGVVLGIAALSGFASAPSGDLGVSSTPWTTNLLLALGSALLLVFEFFHSRRRRPTGADQPTHIRETARSWKP